MPSYFRKDGERERIPGRQKLILGDTLIVFHEDVRAINDLVARNFASPIIDDRQGTIAIHRDTFALTALHRLQFHVLDRAVLAGFVFRRLFQTSGTPMWNVRIVS